MKTIMYGALLMVMLFAVTAYAETYNWIYPRAAGWDATGRWAKVSDPSDTNHWPTLPGDVAIIPSWVTNNVNDPTADMKQFAFNAFGNQPVTFLGEMHTKFSNTWIQIGTFAPTDLLVFDNNGMQSKVSYYSYVYNWNRLEFPIWDTKVVISNDLNLYIDGIATPDGYAHINRIIFGQDSGIYGDHHIISHGPGSLNLGVVYVDSEPYETQIMTTKATILSNGYGELEAGPIFAAPVMVTEGIRVNGSETNDVQGITRQGSWLPIDVDIEFRGGNHRQNWTWSATQLFSPLTNKGDLLVEDQANIQLYGNDSTYGDTWYYFDGMTKGTNFVINWWDGGKANFTGSISPGANPDEIGWLGFVDWWTNAGIIFGMPDKPVDLLIDVTADDSDYISTEYLPNFPVSRANLKLNILGADPAATNIIWFSFENLTGMFASVEIMPEGASATIIYYSNAVAVTDVTVPGDFEVAPDMLEFTEGETQKTVSVSTTTEATVSIAAVGDATSWITVPSEVMVSNGFPADVPVTIPEEQAPYSTGIVRFVSVQIPSLTNDVLVTTIPEPAALVLLTLALGALLRRR